MGCGSWLESLIYDAHFNPLALWLMSGGYVPGTRFQDDIDTLDEVFSLKNSIGKLANGLEIVRAVHVNNRVVVSPLKNLQGLGSRGPGMVSFGMVKLNQTVVAGVHHQKRPFIMIQLFTMV